MGNLIQFSTLFAWYVYLSMELIFCLYSGTALEEDAGASTSTDLGTSSNAFKPSEQDHDVLNTAPPKKVSSQRNFIDSESEDDFVDPPPKVSSNHDKTGSGDQDDR